MSHRDPDPYRVLGIGSDATSAEVARAYRRLARAVHPDSRPGDPAAAGQFRALTEAYGLLSDPARRAAWDQLHRPRPAAPSGQWRPQGPDLWPSPPVELGPAGRPVAGAALRAGPVHVQPLPAGRGGQEFPSDDPQRGPSWLLLASRPAWPW
jgi:curved DNA-binding protein CbpA